ncbi:MAG: cation-translocating P-type ATPase [Fibrobacterota bacterium]
MNSHKEFQKKPWAFSKEKACEFLRTDAEKGLSEKEAKERLESFGYNTVSEKKSRSVSDIFFSQFKNIIVAILAAASVLAFTFGEILEGGSIIVAIVVNILIGFFTELKAARSMEALSSLNRLKTNVKRSGRTKNLDATYIVPGDLIVIEEGDLITADLRIIEASKISANESALTGESVPVEKSGSKLKKESDLHERKNILFKGTTITRGSGRALVVKTGMQTEIGRISRMTSEASSAKDGVPLQRRLSLLGRRLIVLTVIISAFVLISGIASGKEMLLIVETAVALVVAAIPEGLPVVATIGLAAGMRKMAERNALINKLDAVETLGSTNILMTDKTGTITENRMTLEKVILPGEESKYRVLKNTSGEAADNIFLVSALCSNAEISGEGNKNENYGDPLELALLKAAREKGKDRSKIIKKYPEEKEFAFDRESMRMGTIHRFNDNYYSAVKGAPASILEVCAKYINEKGETVKLNDKMKDKISDYTKKAASEGYRILSLAFRITESVPQEVYQDLVYTGTVCLMDPPRNKINESILAFKKAGIEVIMVTGDQPETSNNIAKQTGIMQNEDLSVSGKEIDSLLERANDDRFPKVFSRVTPEQKLKIVEYFQRKGNTIAMTGDGVNDAPALERADIGVSMGKRGTQAARESSDVILKNDAFNSIYHAVSQGRTIFENIRKFIIYLLSGNIGEIMIVGFSLAAGYPLPILPLQILYLNMLSDVFPALALGLNKDDRSLMSKKPRSREESILLKRHWVEIFAYGLIITLSVLFVFFRSQEIDTTGESGVTLSFLTLAFARLWHAFSMRDRGSALFNNNVMKNPYLWGAVAFCAFLLVVAVFIPIIKNALRLQNPGLSGWSTILIASLFPSLIIQIYKSTGKEES